MRKFPAKTGEPSERRRRGSGEVKAAILDNARVVFAEKGFGAASVREIAERAGVYEAMVYRRYPTKSDLFYVAVLDPLEETIDTYIAEQTERAPPDAGTVEDRVRSFMPPLFRIIMKERTLLIALLAAQFFHQEHPEIVRTTLSTAIGRLIDRMRPHLEREQRLLGFIVPNNDVLLLLSFGLVLGTSILREAAEQNNDGSISDLLIEDALVHYVLHGIGASITAGHAAAGGPIRQDQIDKWLDRLAEAERRAVRAELELELLKGNAG